VRKERIREGAAKELKPLQKNKNSAERILPAPGTRVKRAKGKAQTTPP